MGSVCFSNALNTHCAIIPRDYTQQHTLSSAVSSRHSYFFSFSRGKIRPHTDITLTYLLFPRSPPYISSLLSLAYIWSHQAWIDKPFFHECIQLARRCSSSLTLPLLLLVQLHALLLSLKPESRSIETQLRH